MCGIVGHFSRQAGGRIDLTEALRLVYHRGPDDNGIWQDEYVKLGSTRLSILDLSACGHQPMACQNGRYHIVFNGEIYNYLELRAELEKLGHRFISGTDTETVLASFAEWGTDCLQRLRGMFAFALWDKKKETLFLARDRVGEKPLYYWHDGNSFYFASELKALLAFLPHKPALDPIAIDQYLHYQYVPEPRTPLSGINKLPAAHYLLIERQNWINSPKSYWNLEDVQPVTGNPAELIREELNRVIRLTLRSDVPVGIALSGGIDSSGLASLAASKYKDTLMAFTVGYQQPGSYDERTQAKDMAKSLNLPWHEIKLRTEDFVNFFPDMVAIIDEPIADIAAYSHYAVNKLAAEHGVKVMLSGLGGDELFWGYPWVVRSAQLTARKQSILRSPALLSHTDFLPYNKLFTNPVYLKLMYHSRVPAFVRDLLFFAARDKLLSIEYPQQAGFYDLEPELAGAINEVNNFYTAKFRSLIPKRNTHRPFELDLLNVANVPVKICKLLFDTWLVSNSLSLQDRVSMACSVESRVPLLDYKLIELVIGLMKGLPGRHLKPKFWLKSALKGIVPERVLRRKKRGFQPPVLEWKIAVIDKYQDRLLSGYLVEMGIIDQPALLNFLKDKRKHARILYRLLFLEIWYRKVIMRDF